MASECDLYKYTDLPMHMVLITHVVFSRLLVHAFARHVRRTFHITDPTLNHVKE
jgi:hypothetical protein